MGEPTLDDLQVKQETCGRGQGCGAIHGRPLTPAEFDRIATEQGYVKRPVCGTCKGKPLAEGEYWDGQLPNGDEPDFDGPCPSCGGTGFGRLVALDAQTIQRLRWLSDGRAKEIQIGDSVLIAEILDALDGGQE